jgi:hypothetical protein
VTPGIEIDHNHPHTLPHRHTHTHTYTNKHTAQHNTLMSYNTVLYVLVRTNHNQARLITTISKPKYILACNCVSEFSLTDVLTYSTQQSF